MPASEYVRRKEDAQSYFRKHLVVPLGWLAIVGILGFFAYQSIQSGIEADRRADERVAQADIERERAQVERNEALAKQNELLVAQDRAQQATIIAGRQLQRQACELSNVEIREQLVDISDALKDVIALAVAPNPDNPVAKALVARVSRVNPTGEVDCLERYPLLPGEPPNS